MRTSRLRDLIRKFGFLMVYTASLLLVGSYYVTKSTEKEQARESPVRPVRIEDEPGYREWKEARDKGWLEESEAKAKEDAERKFSRLLETMREDWAYRSSPPSQVEHFNP